MKGVDNTGGPGVKPTAGITTDTGVQGVDLDSIDDDEQDDWPAKKAVMRRWRENAHNRLKKGQAPRRFEDIPSGWAEPVWEHLASARSHQEVDAAFAAVEK